MSKKISGAEYPLSKIFSSDFDYNIPSYQRPYAWTTDNTFELIDDLYAFHNMEQDEGYFLGSIVLIKEDGKPKAEVIDGQQRLTTLTILLAVLTSLVDDPEKETLLKYIREPGNKFEGLKHKPRLTIRERDNIFFAKYIHSLDIEKLINLSEQSISNDAQSNIKNNCNLLFNFIIDKFGSDIEKLNEFISFLLQRCFLVVVSTPNKQSAFRVFSVMNSRGMDLQATDIIKADIIGSIASLEDQEDYNTKWEEIEVKLGRSKFNDLFSYIRMIFSKTKAKHKLLDEFKENVLPFTDDPCSLIDDILEPYGEALSVLSTASYKSEENASDINHILKWLNRVGNSDWLPPAILFYTQHKDDPSYLLWFIERLEKLAAFMHICSKNVNYRIDRYADIIKAIEKDDSIDEPISDIELTKDEVALFSKILGGDIYNLTANKRSYVILRLDSFISDRAAIYDSNMLTIEHVLPQTIASDSQWNKDWSEDQHADWLHTIANLVPLNKRRNSKAQNYDFTKKKDAYFKGNKGVSSYALTTQVLNESEWIPTVVSKRHKELLQVFVDKWHLE